MLRKYKQQASNWLGLLTLVDQPKLVHGFCINTQAWQYDPKLDELANEYLKPLGKLSFKNSPDLPNATS